MTTDGVPLDHHGAYGPRVEARDFLAGAVAAGRVRTVDWADRPSQPYAGPLVIVRRPPLRSINA